MLRYPVFLSPDGDGWMARFPDIPEALTGGASREEALEMAGDALETAMDFYFEDGRSVPMPSRVRKGGEFVEMPASLCAKILLLNAMLEEKIRPSDLARKMDTRPQDIQRLMDLKHATKIDTIAEALRVMGKRLELKVV